MKNNKIAEIFNTMNYGPAPESNTNVLNWLKKYKNSSRIFINGEWQKAAPKNLFDSFNPATGGSLGKLAQSTTIQVEAAVTSARKAQKSWFSLGGKGRAKYLYAI
ncbi:MAG: aldehyde dehydrogenase (NAD+), partial [Polaribacter sp.]